MVERIDGSVALDASGRLVREHPLLRRSLDGETVYLRPLRIVSIHVGDRTVDGLEEHWVDDGLRGHTLVFLRQDVDGATDPEIQAATAAHFGVDLDAPKGATAAGGVSVNRRNPEFVFATAAFYSEYAD